MLRKLRFAAAGLAAAAVLAGCAPKIVRTPVPVDLRYKGRAGDAYSYSLAQTFRGRVVNYGMPQLVVLKIRAIVGERVLAVAGSGWLRVQQTSTLEPLEVNGMRVEPEGVPARTQTEIMRSPAGEVVPTKEGGSSSDMVIWAARSIGSVFPLLPPAPVSPGETWHREQDIAVGENGEFQVVTIGELVRVEEGPGTRVAVIRMEGGVNLARPFEAEGIRMEFLRLEYNGLVRFDLDEGRIIESKQDGSLLAKGSSGKSSMEARLSFNSSLTAEGTE